MTKSAAIVSQKDDETAAAQFLEEAGFLRPSALCALLKWTPATEASRRSRGQTPPFFKTGNAVFYRRSDVAEWIANQPQEKPLKVKPRVKSLAAKDLLG